MNVTEKQRLLRFLLQCSDEMLSEALFILYETHKELFETIKKECQGFNNVLYDRMVKVELMEDPASIADQGDGPLGVELT